MSAENIPQVKQTNGQPPRVDYPRRHPSQHANSKVLLTAQEAEKEMSFEEVQRWFELEGKTDTLNLGS